MHLLQKTILLLLLSIAIAKPALAQENNYPAYDTNATELADIQRLIDNTLPDAEMMLKRSGSFKPFAMVILANDSIAEIDVKDTAKSGYTTDDLKEELSIGALKGEYKVVAIFSVESMVHPETQKAIKAVAVFAEHTDDDFAYLFYYPFTINARKDVIFGESFGDFAPQVMFKP